MEDMGYVNGGGGDQGLRPVTRIEKEAQGILTQENVRFWWMTHWHLELLVW